MSALDVKQAKQALAWRLRELGVQSPDGHASAFIDDLTSRGWQMAPDREARPKPPKSGEFCHTCGRHLDTCLCDQPDTRSPLRAVSTPPPPTYLDARRARRGTSEGDAS